MKCSNKQIACSVFLIVTGSLLIAAGVVLITVLPNYIRQQIIQHVQLKNGSELYKIWRNPADIPVYMQFYIFDLKNTNEVLQGEKPIVKERGPYTYKEHIINKDVTNHDNGTISFRQFKQFHFVPDMSVGPDNETFVTVNMVLLTLLTTFKSDWEFFNIILSELLKLDKEDRTLFRRYSVRSVIWGYDDQLLEVGKMFDPSRFKTTKAGILQGKNNSDDGLFNIFTGMRNISKLGIIDKYNGARSLDFWTTPQANLVNGTDGTLCPPFVEKNMVLYMFISDICRSVYSEYESDKTSSDGIPLWRFAAPRSAMENATVNPNNEGFCTPRGNCLGSGVLNISTCKTVDSFHVPIVASMPHFYHADQQYVDAIVGMNPQLGGEEYNTHVNIEPHTGIVMEASKRLQINMYIEQIPGFSETGNIQTMMYPVLWLNESMKLDSRHANMVKNQLLIPMMVVNIVQFIAIGLGGLCFIGCAAYAIVIYTKNNVIEKQKNGVVSEGETTVQGADNEKTPLLDN